MGKRSSNVRKMPGDELSEAAISRLLRTWPGMCTRCLSEPCYCDGDSDEYDQSIFR